MDAAIKGPLQRGSGKCGDEHRQRIVYGETVCFRKEPF